MKHPDSESGKISDTKIELFGYKMKHSSIKNSYLGITKKICLHFSHIF
eukprot:UN00818